MNCIKCNSDTLMPQSPVKTLGELVDCYWCRDCGQNQLNYQGIMAAFDTGASQCAA